MHYFISATRAHPTFHSKSKHFLFIWLFHSALAKSAVFILHSLSTRGHYPISYAHKGVPFPQTKTFFPAQGYICGIMLQTHCVFYRILHLQRVRYKVMPYSFSRDCSDTCRYYKNIIYRYIRKIYLFSFYCHSKGTTDRPDQFPEKNGVTKGMYRINDKTKTNEENLLLNF